MDDSQSRALDIFSLISGWAERTPGAPSIGGVGQSPLSFGRFSQQAKDTVQALNEAGIGRGDRVAIVLPQGPGLAVCTYAVACGAVSVPLNPAYTTAEFEALFARLAPRALITSLGPDSTAAQAARTAGVPLIRWVAQREAGAFHLEAATAGRRTDRGGMARRDEVALILLTSGSTSQPKLVPLTHANLCSSGHNIAAALQLTPADCCLVIMPLFHINALVTSGLSTLAAGGCLACPPEFHAPSFFDWMEEFRPAWYSAVPTMQQAIMARVRQAGYRKGNSRLRFVRSSASSLSAHLREWTEKVLGVPVIDGYGLTEANCSTLNPLPPGIRKPGSVGRVVHGEVSILGENGRFLKRGEIGEIVIRGPQVIRRYEDDPQSDRAFHGEWFRTGDQGRFDEDGYLFLAGRIKEMINRGGEKIGPCEVDNALLAHPSVAQAVAFAIPDPSLGEEIGAAVVLRPGTQVTSCELQEFAGQRIAEFKVPRKLVFLQEIPKGPTGKVQRTGLAAQLGVASAGNQEGSATVGCAWTEWMLTEIWEEVLERRPIGRHEDFVSLGGHSLLAARILARVEKCFGKRLPLSSLLEAPTVARMVALIGDDSRPSASRVISIHRGSSPVPVYLLHANPVFGPLLQGLPGTLPVRSVSPVDVETLPLGFTLEDIARRHVRAIRKFQPVGPYVLAGWCADGVLAYEMARQLRTQGQEVPLLVLLDASNPARIRMLKRGLYWRHRISDRFNRERFSWENQEGGMAGKAFHYVASRCRGALKKAAFRAWRIKLDQGWQHRTRDAHSYQVHAIRKYTPAPYDGPVLLFRAEHRYRGVTGDPAAGWKPLVEDLQVCDVPGNHAEMFAEPNVRVMVRALVERMEALVERTEALCLEEENAFKAVS